MEKHLEYFKKSLVQFSSCKQTERQQPTRSLLETTAGRPCTRRSHPAHTSPSWMFQKYRIVSHPQRQHSQCGSSTDRWIKITQHTAMGETDLQLGSNSPRRLKKLHTKSRHTDWCALCLPAAATPLLPFPTPVCPMECSQHLLQAPIWVLGQHWLFPRCTAIPARTCASEDQKKYSEKIQLQSPTATFVPGQKRCSPRWISSPVPKCWLLQLQ